MPKKLIKPQENEDNERYKFMYSVLQKKMENQFNSYNSLQDKINNLFGFTAIIIGGYITLVFQKSIIFSSNVVVTSFNLLGMIGLVLVMIFLYKATKTRIFLDPPDTETIYSQTAFGQKLGNLKNQVLADIKKCYEDSIEKLSNIALWYDLSLIILFVSTIIILVSAIIQAQCIK